MENTQNEPKYCKTVGELAGYLEISRQEIQSKWMKKDGWPPKTRGGWDVNACREFRADEFKKLAQRVTGVNSDAKSRYWNAHADREIESALTAKIKRLIAEGDVLTIDDARTVMEACKMMMMQWNSEAKVLTGDAILVKRAAELTNKSLILGQDFLKKATKNVDETKI
jgi:hypothetical protein